MKKKKEAKQKVIPEPRELVEQEDQEDILSDISFIE
jgi:hypothetical protein